MWYHIQFTVHMYIFSQNISFKFIEVEISYSDKLGDKKRKHRFTGSINLNFVFWDNFFLFDIPKIMENQQFLWQNINAKILTFQSVSEAISKLAQLQGDFVPQF